MKASICLNMIVKNESCVIKRCLESVKSLIDYWVIVDTGSNDGTQEVIRETLAGIPGELHERPWVNFAHNRTEALRLAKGKGSFALLIDADEELVIEPGFIKPDLGAQVYLVEVHYGIAVFHRELFVNTHYDWIWEGVLHEQIKCKSPLEKVLIAQKIHNISHPDGGRSLDPKKHARDAELLEEALQGDPDNTRYVFYLAQSYANSGQLDEARKQYERRAQMGGWDQEVYFSLYANAYIQQMQNKEPHVLIAAYEKAYRARRSRAEPLYRMGDIYFNSGQFSLARIVSQYGLMISHSRDSMFVEPDIYRFGMRLLYADSCRALNDNDEALRQYEAVIKVKDLPPDTFSDVQESIKRLRKCSNTGGIHSWIPGDGGNPFGKR